MFFSSRKTNTIWFYAHLMLKSTRKYSSNYVFTVKSYYFVCLFSYIKVLPFIAHTILPTIAVVLSVLAIHSNTLAILGNIACAIGGNTWGDWSFKK